MHFQTTAQDVVHDDQLAHQVAKCLHCRLGGQVRGLKVFSHTDGLILHGRVSTYYGKQLAQQVAMEISGRSIVANDIEVL
jgi:osmotically-inducible protein OsmY